MGRFLEAQSCHLLAGPFATFLQIMVGLIAGSTLVYKRYFIENPRRPLTIWLMDVSKQGFSSVIIHFWNIIQSILLSKLALSSPLTSSNRIDECSLYFIYFLLDTVIGVFLIWFFLSTSQSLATSLSIHSLRRQGYYGNPPRMDWYIKQLLCFVLITMTSKFLLGILMYTFSNTVIFIGSLLFKPFEEFPDSELFFVMIVYPCIFSIIQYWLQDNFLMNESTLGGYGYDILDDQSSHLELK